MPQTRLKTDGRFSLATCYRSSAYRSSAYRSSAYRSSAYRSSAYRSSAYRSSAYRSSAYRSSVCIAAALAASATGAFICPTFAQANPVVQQTQEPTSGAYGWANTSNVKVHVRPSALTPHIAQVPHQTRMFVRGKFDGWYHVETSEKVLGWVYYKHLNVPEAGNIQSMSHEQSRQACEQSHNLTMYGTPDMLRQYYAQYKAPGALRGLKLQNASLNSGGQTGSGPSGSGPSGSGPSSNAQVLQFNNNSSAPTAVQAGNTPAISAQDILQARDSYLRQNRQSNNNPPVVVTPSSTENSPQAELQDALQDALQEALQGGDELRIENIVSLQKSPALQFAQPETGNAPQFDMAPEVKTIVSFQTTPQNTPVNRGGSPRDRALYNEAMGLSMANQALSYRGKPYVRGASSPSRGFDCSGLVYYLLRQRGYNPPRTAAGLATYGTAIPKTQLQPGDMVFFANTYKRGVSHIGVYIGDSKFVHAATSRTGVKVNSLNEAYYKQKWHSARRVPPK